MKNISPLFYSILLIYSSTYSNNNTPYFFINKLSRNSKLREHCAFKQSALFELTDTESSCSTLNHRLKLLFEDAHTISDFLLTNKHEAHNYIKSSILKEDIEKAVEIILKNESDSMKFQEFANIYRAIANHQIKNKINKERMDRRGKFNSAQPL